MVDGKKICLTDTCGFERLFQILLVGYLDYEELQINIKGNKNKLFIFRIVRDVAENNITQTRIKSDAKF